MEGTRLVTGVGKDRWGDHTLYVRQYNAADGKYIEKMVPVQGGSLLV